MGKTKIKDKKVFDRKKEDFCNVYKELIINWYRGRLSKKAEKLLVKEARLLIGYHTRTQPRDILNSLYSQIRKTL